MKSLTIFINESLSNKQKEFIGQIFSTMFKDSKLTREQVLIILNNLYKEVILEISKYFSKNESIDYLAYDPGEDTFLKYEENKEQILQMISEYISKYKV